MDSWFNMLLLCGLLLIASLQTTNAFRFRRSESEESHKLETYIRNLRLHYNTEGPEWIGKHVFVSHLDQLSSKASCTCQALLLESMLKIYEDIFKDMKNKSKETEVKDNLTYVISKVHELKHRYSQEQKVWRELQDIHSIKVKNGTIQGALNDFLMVFKKAKTVKPVKLQSEDPKALSPMQ
ncbi:interferon gamma-related-like [Carassius gibelio]|uniref:interferon gamma-related-like n=1 Tax=Carassius gibelio TaxID=101364 RepID=UPI0022779F5C|nr:interferon gamma-related-like [Carassius gibelio]